MRLMIVFVLFIASLLASESRTFTDVMGKNITLPEHISRIYGSAPPITFMLYVIDGNQLVGVNFPQKNKDNANGEFFLSNYFMSLPILGGWHGNNTPNLEAIINAKPEVIVTWDTALLNEKTLADIKKLAIPALKVNIDDSKNYPDVFRYLGKVMHKEERANALASMAQTYLDELKLFVDTIPENERTKVYYAEGDKGLQTECDISFHSEPLMLAGGNLVHKCVQNSVIGMQEINFEQVMNYAPEVIIVQSELFYKTIFTDKKWQSLKAVQNKRVYLVPKTPFNWTDRPPSFMRIIGAHWITSKLYPKRYPYSIHSKVREYYKLFFGVELSDENLKTYFAL
ncbi:MAG: ABC transporter substrate-binding protein [Sulfurospirillaceae bacterium]|nr:ABC transporter substrate-binding protein [Sulfurospirillaceae bacterium]